MKYCIKQLLYVAALCFMRHRHMHGRLHAGRSPRSRRINRSNATSDAGWLNIGILHAWTERTTCRGDWRGQWNRACHRDTSGRRRMHGRHIRPGRRRRGRHEIDVCSQQVEAVSVYKVDIVDYAQVEQACTTVRERSGADRPARECRRVGQGQAVPRDRRRFLASRSSRSISTARSMSSTSSPKEWRSANSGAS